MRFGTEDPGSAPRRPAYLAAVKAHQMQGATLIVRSVWRDHVLRTVSFGSYQPAAVVTQKAA